MTQLSTELGIAGEAGLINAIFQRSSEAMGVSTGGLHVLVNPAYVQLFGYESAAELIGRPITDLIAVSSRALVGEYVRLRGGPGAPAHYQVRGLRNDGVEFDMDVRVWPHLHDGRMHSLVLLRDVTAENEAQRTLAESREFYRALFNVNTAVKLLVRPATGRIVDANAAAEAFYGWPLADLCQMTIAQINTLDEAEVAEKAAAAATGGRRYFECKHRTALGIRDVEVYVGPVAVGGEQLLLSIIHDVTGRRALEEQLRQAQKMEAIGRLAGGIAHDFNNLLLVMLGYGELALDTLPVGSPERQQVEGMWVAAERARDLTRQLLAFSRRQVLQPKRVLLTDVVCDLEGLLARTLGPAITLRIERADALPLVLADPGQVGQVLLNLAINARDAMPDGGLLTIKTYVCPQAPPARGSVALEVRDTGAGMDAATAARVFEPFFTTKAAGEGTGLGLSIVYGIIAQSGGEVRVESVVGQGTVFTVFLPVAPEGSDDRAEAVPAARRPTGARVLLVDDQRDVREVMTAMLENSGYRVTAASGADEAIRLFKRGYFGLLVTDVAMPGRNGIELAKALGQIEPTLPVLLVSGDLKNYEQTDLPSWWGFLQKPFGRDAFVRAVGDALAQATG